MGAARRGARVGEIGLDTGRQLRTGAASGGAAGAILSGLSTAGSWPLKRKSFFLFLRVKSSIMIAPLKRASRAVSPKASVCHRPPTGMSTNRTTVLFVDDDVGFLEVVRNLMLKLSEDTWEILVAADAAHGLGLIHEHKIDLLVIDVRMPVMDGLQFLALLHRNYPSLLKVALTGNATESYRAACLSNGAELFLEKPIRPEGWKGLYSTLKELVRLQPEEGFRGVLRRVGLQDVLQMECLARSSSVLKIQAGSIQGTVYVKDGQIVHAQAGSRIGEEAFQRLMGLAGGEFDVQPFTEPPTRSITGSWEFLLMEAARKRDEEGPTDPQLRESDSGFPTPASPEPAERHTPAVHPVIEAASPSMEEPIPEQGEVAREQASRP